MWGGEVIYTNLALLRKGDKIRIKSKKNIDRTTHLFKPEYLDDCDKIFTVYKLDNEVFGGESVDVVYVEKRDLFFLLSEIETREIDCLGNYKK